MRCYIEKGNGKGLPCGAIYCKIHPSELEREKEYERLNRGKERLHAKVYREQHIGEELLRNRMYHTKKSGKDMKCEKLNTHCEEILKKDTKQRTGMWKIVLWCT